MWPPALSIAATNRRIVDVEGRKLRNMFGSSTNPETDKAKPVTEEGRSKLSPAGPVTETSSQAAGADAAPRRRAKTLGAKEVNLFYGDFHPVENLNMTTETNKVPAAAGTSTPMGSIRSRCAG